MSVIKVGYLISYDYKYVKTSLPRVYDHVDEIYFAVDIEGKTWAGMSMEIDGEFWAWVKEFDKAGKVTIYKDRFYIPGLTAMQCDTRERNLLGKHMGEADWHIQIDSDEYFVDFLTFIQKLRNYQANSPTSVSCRVLTMFKEVFGGYLIIGDSIETLSFATNNPVYDIARNNDSGNLQVKWDDLVLHQSWARSSEEIYLKLNNWSHKDDFNVNSFFNLWTAIDIDNYYVLHNFHPLHPPTWPKLTFVAGDVDEMKLSDIVGTLGQPIVNILKKKSFFSRLWKKLKHL